MVAALAQIDIEMDTVAAAAAEEDGRPIGRKPRPVGGQEQIRLQLLAVGLAHLPQVGRADLLAGLDDEFDVEAELAAAGLAHGAQGREIDAVLALVVGGAAAIDALAFGRGFPGIEIVAPLAFHAVDDVAMAIGEHGRQRGILAIIRQQIRTLAARRFDQAGGEVERGEGGLQVVDEIGAQRLAAAGVLAFGPVTDPAVELGEKRAGIEMLTYPRNRVGSCRHFLFLVRQFCGAQPIGIIRPLEVAWPAE